jgi:hypothetical protein
MKRPFDYLREYYRSALEKTEENEKDSHQNSMEFVNWSAGFSVAIATLCFSNINYLNTNFHSKNVFILLVLISIHLIASAFFKFYYQRYLSFISHANFEIKTALSGDSLMDPFEDEDVTQLDFYSLILKIKTNYNDDFEHLKPLFENSDQSNKEILRKSLIEHYNNTKAWVKKDFEIAGEFIKDNYFKFYGLRKNQLHNIMPTKEQADEYQSDVNLYDIRKIVHLCYVISLFSFITIPIFFTIVFGCLYL